MEDCGIGGGGVATVHRDSLARTLHGPKVWSALFRLLGFEKGPARPNLSGPRILYNVQILKILKRLGLSQDQNKAGTITILRIKRTQRGQTDSSELPHSDISQKLVQSEREKLLINLEKEQKGTFHFMNKTPQV